MPTPKEMIFIRIKVDFLKWQHQELVCLDCAGLSVNQTQQVIASDGDIIVFANSVTFLFEL